MLTSSVSTQRPAARRRTDMWLCPRAAPLLAALTALGLFTLLLALVQVQWAPLQALDETTAHGLNELMSERPRAVGATETVTLLGDKLTWWIVTAATVIWLLTRRRVRPAVFVATAGLGGGLLNRAAKEVVGRHRPDLAEPVSHASGLAFPSGHAMASTVGVGVLLLVLLPVLPPRWRRPTVAAGVLVVLVVGLSRVVLGVHWPSDVIGGWLLSAAWLLAITGVCWPRCGGHVAPQPAPSTVHEQQGQRLPRAALRRIGEPSESPRGAPQNVRTCRGWCNC